MNTVTATARNVHAPAPQADLEKLKVRQQAAWSSGDYALIGTTLGSAFPGLNSAASAATTPLLAPTLHTIEGRPVSPGSAAAYTIDSDLTRSIELTGVQIDAAIRAVRPDSGLIGLGDTFVRAGRANGVNPLYVAAHAAWNGSASGPSLRYSQGACAASNDRL